MKTIILLSGCSGRCLLLAAVCFFCLPAQLALSAAEIQIETNTKVATAGFYRLSWRAQKPDTSAENIYELQEAKEAAFADPRRIYYGPDLARVMSGKSDGTRYYRVRINRRGQEPGPWSNTLKVVTQHHSLFRAFGFFAAGAVVFLLTLVTVVRGTRQ